MASAFEIGILWKKHFEEVCREYQEGFQKGFLHFKLAYYIGSSLRKFNESMKKVSERVSTF